MKKEYKQLYNEIKPDDKLLDKVLNSTDIKTPGHLPRKMIAGILCLVMLVLGGGTGINYLTKNHSGGTSDRISQGGILIAYAGTDTAVRLDDIKLSEMPIFYHITIINENASEDEIHEKYAAFGKVKNQIYGDTEKIGKTGKGIRGGSGQTGGTNSTLLYCDAGEFMLELDDYSDVEALTVSNESIYGTVLMEIGSLDDYDYIDAFRETHSITVTGEELQDSKDSGLYSVGFGKHEINKGYIINWGHSTELIAAAEENPDFDLTQIRDKMVFEVVYKDGDVTRAAVDISFDENGNMVLRDGGFEYTEA